MNDTEMIDFIEDNGIQLWREATGIWTAQIAKPLFIQCSHVKLRTAVIALREKLLAAL